MKWKQPEKDVQGLNEVMIWFFKNAQAIIKKRDSYANFSTQ